MAGKRSKTLKKENLEDALEKFEKHPIFGSSRKIIKQTLDKISENTNPIDVALKVIMIDSIYNTFLSKSVEKLGGWEKIAEHIIEIKDEDGNGIDFLIENGKPEAVNRIAKMKVGKNYLYFYSFASKYCFCHNYFVYGKDDYTIYDSVLRKRLPEYFKFEDPYSKNRVKVTKNKIEKWVTKQEKYELYNEYVTKNLKYWKKNNNVEEVNKVMLDAYLRLKYRNVKQKKATK